MTAQYFKGLRSDLAIFWLQAVSPACPAVRDCKVHPLYWAPRLPLQPPRPSRAACCTRWARVLLLGSALPLSACVQGRPATDSGDPGFPFGPSAVGKQTIAYAQDILPIFNRDCALCHGDRENAGNYSVSTYANTMSRQRPGDASSSLVVDCSPGGSMYQYFSGDAVTEATMVFRWMVYYNAAESR